jgi:hypothetical protein
VKTAVFTSVTFAYLDRARVLFHTVREFHPDWDIWLCLVDEKPPGFAFDAADEEVDGVVTLGELDVPDVLSWAFAHEVVELCTAVKGEMLCRLLRSGYDRVFYIDPDIALFGRLDEAEGLLDRHCAVLTPHLIDPEETPAGIADNEMAALKHGIFNLGFLAVAGTGEGRAFASWWRDRLVGYCYDDIPRGLFTDQKWCDHAPVFFPSIAVLRHRGYNVASWNLSRRTVTIGRDGVIRAGGEELRFFHFTKLGTVGRVMIERHAGEVSDVLELVAWYERLLQQLSPQGVPSGWWRYGTYDGGAAISRDDRLAHRRALAEGRAIPRPFASDAPVADIYARSGP